LLREVRDRSAIVGPARIWTQAHSSYHRVLRARELALAGDTDTIDTDTHLVDLVLGADREAAGDLRRLVLAPLDRLGPNTAERLAQHLRACVTNDLLPARTNIAIVSAKPSSTRRSRSRFVRARANAAVPHDPTSL